MRFARPAIHLPGIVNPASTRSPSGATAGHRRTVGEVVDAWRSVVERVQAAGLLFGIRFATPPRQDQMSGR